MIVIESILRDLNELPNPTLVDVARYVHSLNPKSKERRLVALQATAGCLDAEEGEAFEQAVKAERIEIRVSPPVTISSAWTRKR
jgi:hypothetical protein